MPADHKLFAVPNVIVTCHTAADSDKSYIECEPRAASDALGASPMCKVVGVLCGIGPSHIDRAFALLNCLLRKIVSMVNIL